MGYCPLDRVDYNEQVEECVVCGGPLIEESIEEIFEDVDPREWVDLDPLTELVHAVKVREALDESKIPCYIKSDLAPGSDYYNGQAVISVPESQYDAALEIQQGIAPPDDDQMIIDPDSEDDW